MNENDLNYSKGTISMTLVHEALHEAKLREINITELLQKSGIMPELLHSSRARISVMQYAQLWVELANTMNDEFFGMDSHPMRRGSYKLLSSMVRHADTLEKAIRDILNFMNLILDDFQSQLQLNGNEACIVIHDAPSVKRMFSYATYIMLIHGLVCWLSGQRIVLNHVQLRCKKPEDDQDYKVRFCNDIIYESQENRISFDAAFLNIKIKQDKKSWHDFISSTPQNLLVRFKNPHAISNQIRKHLMQLPPSQWLELNEISQRLNMSDATIQRRLKSEGVSYQQLKNDIRRDTAIELLSKTELSLQDISEKLNFHDPSAFHRAFKKWTGVSPGSYRNLNDL